MRTLIYSLLKETLGIDVYQDFVPETATLPAAAYYIVSENTEGALSGGVDYRIVNITCDVVTSKSRLSTDSFVNKIRAIDKTRTKDFQFVNILSINDIQLPNSNSKFFQTSVDISLIPYKSRV